MAYEITFALPQDPMPPITDADAYLHGNGHIRGVFEQRGPFYAEFVTEPRENIAAGACYDEWRIMGSPELYRYKYDSATNTVILQSQFPPSQVVFYCMGDRGEDNDWSVADLLPEVEANGIALHVSGTGGPQTDRDVYPGWGTPPFDPVDFEATFNINTDLFLPVWSFRANWREPMSERLSFLTDVLTASEGAEQRRSLRPTPRRSFEADFLLTGPERTFWDLFVNKLGGGEVTVPLYWETVTLGTALTATVSDRIAFDTTYREWPYLEGRRALLMGKTALDYEVVEIASVDTNGVDLVAPVSRPWPKGTKLLPLRRAVLDQVGDLNHKTAGTATATVQFRVIGPNPWTPAADASPTRDGLPIFLSEPNWVEDLTAEMGRDIALLDTTVGRTYQIDSLGRVRLGQAHRWFLPGRQKLAGFRDLIYRHKGRTGAFWLPTFKADFRLAASAGSAATQITVENVGFFYTGGPTSGREYIAIKHDGGTILRKILSVVPGSTAATEKLNLDAALGLALSPGQVRRISFADVARFDTDEFEIVHYGGADAHHDVSAMFLTFKNTRSAPLPINFPIPAGAETPYPCGTPIFTVTFELPMNPMPPIHDSDGYAHGNGHIRGSIPGHGAFFIEWNTEERSNVPGGSAFNKWKIVLSGSEEVARLIYDSGSNTITLVAIGLSTLYYYSLGNRTEAGWTSGNPIQPVTRINRQVVDPISHIGPQTDTSVYPGWGTPTFPPVDVEYRYL